MSDILKFIEKVNKYGKVETSMESYPRISTGSLVLDSVIGGGWPKGAMSEIYGEPGTGKSTLALLGMLNALPEAAEKGKYCFYLDIEEREKYTPEWWAKLGLPFRYNPETGKYDCFAKDEKGIQLIHIVSVKTAEDAANFLIEAIEGGYYHYGVIDSLAQMSPSVEKNTDANKSAPVGLLPRLLSRLARTMNSAVVENEVTLIMLNHTRDKVGADLFDPQKTISPGGHHIKHMSSVRLEMQRIKAEYDSNNIRSVITFRPMIIKNSTADHVKGWHDVTIIRDPKSNTFNMDYPSEAFDVGKGYGFFTNKDGEIHKGGYCYWNPEKWGYEGELEIEEGLGVNLGKSRNECVETLTNDPDLLDALERAIRYEIKMARVPVFETEENGEEND